MSDIEDSLNNEMTNKMTTSMNHQESWIHDTATYIPNASTITTTQTLSVAASTTEAAPAAADQCNALE